MSGFLQVMTTIDSEEGAQKIARGLVERRLAACVQVSGPVHSTYWWQGQLESAQEWVCTGKTRAELYDEVEKVIRELHTYAEPEIIASPIVRSSSGYLAWIMAETPAQP